MSARRLLAGQVANIDSMEGEFAMATVPQAMRGERINAPPGRFWAGAGFSLMERTEIGEVSRAGRSGGSERCDHHGSEHDPAPPLVLYGGSSGHFSPGGEVDETVRPRGQILREFGVGLLVRFFCHA
jgi:hypothetical protein